MARRRSIYDTGNYSTPLADFLDEIPDYFLKFEQLKQAEADRADQKAFRNQQYRDEIAQQNKNNIYRQEQAEYKKVNDAYNRQSTAIERMDGVPTDIKAKMFSDLNSRPEFSALGLDNAGANNYQAQMKKLKDDFFAYEAEYTDISDLSDDEEFANYARIETLRDNMKENRSAYRGTTWDGDYKVMTTALSNKLSDLSNKSGKSRGDVLTISDKGRVKSLREGISKNMNQRDENDAQLTQTIASYRNAGFSREKINDKSEVKELISKSALYNQRIKENEAEILSIQNKPEYKYPSITTSADLTEMSNMAQEQTKWVTEEATDLWKFDPDARLKLLSDEPVNPEEFENIKATYEDIKREERETKELGDAFSKKLGIYEDSEEDIPPMWKEPATEPIEGEGVEEDMFADLSTELQLKAKKLRDRGVPDEQILAQINESEVAKPDPEPKPRQDIELPSVAEPLTARSDRETETIIKEREKEAEDAELFPEPLKPTNVKYIISDISKSGKETGKVRRYVDYSLGKNLKQLKDLRKRAPEIEERGDKYNLKQINEKISSLENKIRESIGDYVNPETGEFSNPEYTKRIYRSLKRTLPDLQMRELMDLLRDFSTAQGTSKVVSWEPVTTSKAGTVYSAIK